MMKRFSLLLLAIAALFALAFFVSDVGAQEPITITVANGVSLCSATDSTTAKNFFVDLDAYGVDVRYKMTAWFRTVSDLGATNCSVWYHKTPTGDLTYYSTADTIKAYSARATETMLSDSVSIELFPQGRYVAFRADPNIGAGVTGRSDTKLYLFLVGVKKEGL